MLFRSRLAEDIFDDGLSGFRIVTDSVPALPASVLSFADVPFPVRSSFWHGISPFRNEQYRNQEDKATRKRNCYQKVIICLAVTSAPNLCLWRRNFCAAEAFSLVTAVRFLNGQKAFPLTTAAQNMYDLR